VGGVIDIPIGVGENCFSIYTGIKGGKHPPRWPEEYW